MAESLADQSKDQHPVQQHVQRPHEERTPPHVTVETGKDVKKMDKQTLMAVLQFLKKNNLKDTVDILKKETNFSVSDEEPTTATDQDVSSVLSAYTSEGDPSQYDDNYSNVLAFIESALDMYKSPQHCFSSHAAVSFFAKHFGIQEEYHQEDLVKLSTVTKKEHMKSNELMINFRSSKFTIKMSRDSYQLLKRYLNDKQQSVLLDLLQEHLYIDVFDGLPRNKQQIDATAGAMTGAARREANKTKVFYGLLKEPEINLPLEEEEEGAEGEDKPKKKKVKRDSHMGKKNKPDPNAPALSRIPLPSLRDIDKMERVIAMRETLKRIKVSADNLPSICFYTFLNAYQNLTSAEISEDSSMMAAGFADSLIRVWTLTPKKLRAVKPIHELMNIDKEADDVLERIMDERTATDNRVLLGHSGPVYATSFSPDRTMLLSASEDCTVRLWSLQMFVNLVCYRGHNYPVWDVQFSPYGYYFVSVGHDRTARLWATENHQPLRVFSGHLSDVDCVKFHPNSNYIATGSSDRTCRLWDVSSGNCVRILTGHKAPIHSIAFSPDGKHLATAGVDKTVLLWDIGHGSLIGRLVGHTDTIYSLCFSRDGSTLASGGIDNCVKLWDVNKVFGEVDTDEITNTTHITLSENTNYLFGSYPSKSTPIHHLHFTRRNLLLATGPFVI
ncbi:transcription initiation factor TFIID subunit 5-like [Saccoglossus kowalevskii]|uniref:Transcription initiation factor TFIID subunit 5-like n=1 Tax=Saccoglossus kowalevskii TaxID=10224 RepID=A0ABM0MN28_SACKO|nr:PREDICTED: transcription initiation factor TFIID subunit 5-like [Saccoglossus kowalevskii]